MRDTSRKAVKGKSEVFIDNKVISREQYEKTQQYRNKYQQDSYKQIQLRVSYQADPDLMSWLVIQSNFNKYIRRLVREHMERLIKEGKIVVTEDNNIHVLVDPEELECDMAQSEEYWARHPKKQVKRGKVGRPRKVAAEAAEAEQEPAATEIKRRRGRPRKVVTEE